MKKILIIGMNYIGDTIFITPLIRAIKKHYKDCIIDIVIETGRVLGNIEAPKIDVGEGAIIQGEMTITGGQKKNITKVVEESFTVNNNQPSESLDKNS